MASVFDKSLKGVFTPHRKNTMEMETVDMPVPDMVYIVMSQHMGPPCQVQVKVGDEVKVGQVVGDSEALFSAPIHSSVSGTVKRIDEIAMPNGTRSQAVVIETDKQQELHPDLKPPVVNSREDFVAAVRASGLVGLGGAGFPSHVKMNPKNLSEVHTLILNAAECEPYITTDYRTIMEKTDDIIAGIKIILEQLDMKRCVIGVEDNKPKGIQTLKDAAKGDERISVVALKSKYPQGAEKVLAYETVGAVVPEGKLPSDVGLIVTNINTVYNIAKYLRTGIPLIAKRITVDGGAVTKAQNVRALIGTPIKDVMEFCGGYKQAPKKILMGGPMMGLAVYDDSYPIVKNNNAILAFDSSQVEEYSETPCIRCGRCVRACPMNLMPLRIEDSFLREDVDGLKEYKVNLCMECGCCAYACPAKRHLVQVHRLAKARVRKSAG